MAALTPPSVPVEAVAPPSRTALRIAEWRPWIAEAAQRFSVPQAWIEAVMIAESGGRTQRNGAPITSRAGAMGLMQLMPETYRLMARAHGLGPDPHAPRDNILAGAAYLAAMRSRFGYPGAFAAYNAGPGRYAEHLRTGKPLPAETRRYILELGKLAGSADLPPTTLSGARLFHTGSGSQAVSPSVAPPPGLFFTLGSRGKER